VIHISDSGSIAGMKHGETNQSSGPLVKKVSNLLEAGMTQEASVSANLDVWSVTVCPLLPAKES